MAKRKSFAVGILVAAGVIVLGLAGVGAWYFSQGEKQYSGPVEKFTIAQGVTPNSALVHIAFVEGYFAEQGLDVEMQLHTSGKAAVKSLLEGNADLAELGDIPFMLSIMRGAKIKLITTMNTTENILTVVANRAKGIETPEDFKGKKIGITFGTGGHFFLSVFLTVNGISLKEVELVNLKPNDLVAAIGNGEIDAVSTWQPHGLRSQERLGDDAIVFSSRGIHRETWNIAGNGDFIKRNPGIIERILRALLKAEELVKDNPDKAIDDTAKYTGSDREQFAKIWSDIDFGLTLNQSLLITLEDETRWAIDNNLVDTTLEPNYLEFLYFDALDAVKPGAVTVIR